VVHVRFTFDLELLARRIISIKMFSISVVDTSVVEEYM
jgi:hypothetical protein